MNQRRKQLLHLLQTSHRFLEHPQDEQKWRDFQEALQVVEDVEKFESLAAQPENLKSPDEETRRLLRRYYENEVRPANRRFRPQLWSSAAAAVFVVIGCYLIFNLTPLPAYLSSILGIQTPTATSTPTPTSTVTSSPTTQPTATSTAVPTTALPSSTPTSMATSSAVPLTAPPSATPIPTATNTPAPTETMTLTPLPSDTPTLTPTPLPPLTSQQIDASLSADSPSQSYTFQARAGDVVTFHLDSDDFDPYIALQYEDGSQIMANDDCGSLRRACIGPIRLTQDGVYTLTIDSFSRHDSGQYSLTITVIPANCAVEPPRAIIISDKDSINLRDGPGDAHNVVGALYNGECFAIIGRNQNSSWLKIQATATRSGWIRAALAAMQGDLETVPVVSS